MDHVRSNRIPDCQKDRNQTNLCILKIITRFTNIKREEYRTGEWSGRTYDILIGITGTIYLNGEVCVEAKFQGNMHAPCIKSELCVRILCREEHTATFVCNPEVRARLGYKLRSPLNVDNCQGNWTEQHNLEKDYIVQKNTYHWALIFSSIWVKQKRRKMRRLKRRSQKDEIETQEELNGKSHLTGQLLCLKL